MGGSVTAESIVRTSDRPDLVPVVAGWLWEAFWRPYGHTLDHLLGLTAAAVADIGPPQTFVLVVDGEPVGTAGLIAHDLDERPDLTPWLAGVFVAPAHRGRGHATRLIAAVEDAARSAAIARLWLYTIGAEGLYTRAGWRRVETFQRHGVTNVLMDRDLTRMS